MQIVVNSASTDLERSYREQRAQELAELACERHKEDGGEWKKGEPVKAWFSTVSDVVVEYQNGEQWYYIDVEFPFPTYWRIDNI